MPCATISKASVGEGEEHEGVFDNVYESAVQHI